MAGPALPGGAVASDALVSLVNDVSRAAWSLWGRAFNSVYATRRLTVDEADDMGIDERIAAGDREAIYDAIVEARDVLDDLRERIGNLLVDSAETLDRLNALRSAKERLGGNISPLVRFTKKEARRTDAEGLQRQRSRMSGARSGKSR